MAMKVELILVLLNSLFNIQACTGQGRIERGKIDVAEHIKKETSVPLDTSVNGIILDDTVSLNNILGKRLPVINFSNYGECTVCSNIDGTEFLILCVNYGGYINQYDKFVVVPSHSIIQPKRIRKTLFKKFCSGLGAYIGCDIKEIEKQMMMMNKVQYKTTEGVETVYSQSLPDWPYHCEYHFMNNRLVRYEFDYRDS